MTTLTDKLDAMVKVAREATSGPWTDEHGEPGDRLVDAEDTLVAMVVGVAHDIRTDEEAAANAAHIAQSHPTVFAALCEVAVALDAVRTHWNGGQPPEECEHAGLRYLGPAASMLDSEPMLRAHRAITALERALEGGRD